MVKNKELIIDSIKEAIIDVEGYKKQQDKVNDKVSIAITILDELIKVNKQGLNKKKFSSIIKECMDGPLIQVQEIYLTVLRTNIIDILMENLRELDEVYPNSLFSIEYNSKIVKSIFNVYLECVDEFDNEETYWACVNYLSIQLVCLRTDDESGW